MITVVVVAAWLLCGCAVAMFMVRRGHSPYLWLILVCFGPLAILFGLGSRDDEATLGPKVTRVGEIGSGPLHLLLGIDGSRSSLDAARQAVVLLGEFTGEITLAAVLDYEAPETHPRGDAEQEADAWLVEAANAIENAAGLSPGRVVLFGDPVRQLTRWADEHGVNLIGVAARSHWATRHLLAGSVTKGLVERAPCPVIVLPQPVPSDKGTFAPDQRFP